MENQKIEILRSGKIVGDDVKNPFGFYAWPTVAKLKDGTLAAVFSGRRTRHIDPFGTTMISYSKDEGKTWTLPAPVIDTPLDDRDGGICVTENGKVYVTSFNNSIAQQREWANWHDRTEAQTKMYHAYLDMLTEKDEEEYLGFLMAESADGYTFSEPYKVPVSAPHGPVILPNGEMLYVGREFGSSDCTKLGVYKSCDGRNWERISTIKEGKTANGLEICEPHAIAFESGKIVVLFRKEGKFLDNEAGQEITTYQCESFDGGHTFSEPYAVLEGAPPFLFKHSSGTVICAYAYRKKPYTQRVMFSNDECTTWSKSFEINGDAKFFDLGYHSVAELSDGSIISVYYQTLRTGQHTNGIYYTIWKFERSEQDDGNC